MKSQPFSKIVNEQDLQEAYTFIIIWQADIIIGSMYSRIVKQFIYGFGYLSIMASLLVGGYFIFAYSRVSCFDNLKNQNEEEIDCGGGCISCALKNLAPLRVLPMKIFNAEGSTTVFVQIQNSNLEYAAKSFSYQFNLYNDQGIKIFTFDDQRLVYAGDTVSFTLPVLEATFSKIARSELLISQVDWTPKDTFSKPETAFSNLTSKVDKSSLVVEGDILNNNLYSLGEVIINALLISPNGFFVNASKTNLDNLSPLGSKHFKLFIPVSGSGKFTIDNVRLFVEAWR